jgi:glyoxylase-like metal-dependent hydrolase (beta-lactamase superfamily II)
VLFAADTIANKKVPSLHEALPFEWLDSLRKLQKLDCELVVPGHGAVGDGRLILDMATALETAMDSVKDAIDKGSSLQEAKDRITVFEDYGDFLPGKEFRRWLNRINVGRLYQLLKERM